MPSAMDQEGAAARLIPIKLAFVAVLGLLVWPLPAMIGFNNPADAQVLGRYTAKYFAFLALYVAVALAWAGLTAWTILKFDQPTLSRLRDWANRRPTLTALLLAAAALPLLAVRIATLARITGYPESFRQVITILPSLLLVAIAAIAALLADSRIRRSLDEWIGRAALAVGRLRIPFGREGRAKADPEAVEKAIARGGMLLLALILLGSALHKRFWNYPLDVDGSMQVYIGRHLLNGGIPFRTLIIEYGPLRYVLSLLWNLGARATGLHVVHFARGANLVVAIGLLLTTYSMGKRLTGRRFGGLLAATILLGTELLFDLLIGGPLFRLTTALVMSLAVLAGQRSRWFWAGVLAGCATLLYTPMLILDIALLAAVVLQGQSPRRRALGYFVGGGGLVAGVALGVLAVLGLAGDAYRLVLVSVLSALPQKVTVQGDAAASSFVLRLPWHITVLRWNLRGDWELALLMGLGVLISVLPGRVRRTLRSPEVVVPLLAAIPLFVSILIDEGDATDVLLRIVLLAPFGAEAVVAGLTALADAGHERLGYLPIGRFAAIWVVLLAIGLGDCYDNQRYLYSLVNVSLREQQRMADDLAEALEPDQTVLCTTNVWYLTLTGADNALPIRRFGAKARLLEVSGWTHERILTTLEQNPPAVVMWLGDMPDDIDVWLQEEYRYMGYLDPDSRFFEQLIYVRNGEDAVAEIISKWPLEKGTP